MAYSEDNLLMISALQHLAFCERQCALIHLEQQWAENRFTVLGEILHEKVHSPDRDKRNDCITVRSLRLVSYSLGLTGQADVVEFHKCAKDENGIEIVGSKGFWRPFPVEYKKGKPKSDNIDAVQLCAQSICLEEQLNTRIPQGALFYGEKRRRQTIQFDKELRNQTISLTERLHSLFNSGVTPAPGYTKKCKSCSLVDICNPKLPDVIKRKRYEELLFEGED
ncbi:MAG: CRISPR-associated protein Cas4 [Proteobacteria bacterium]|nr:CRISPR-associated protein Cas4 [Pseudomonadota bacterium]